MKVAIIGYGYMGQIRRRVITRMSELELLGICDPFIQTDSENSDVPFYDNYEDLLCQSPDIVFVCTPNHLTPEVALAALAQGCHVFAEKPPGRNLADIKRIMDMEAKQPQLKLMFGFNHRHHPAIREAKSIVDAGRMGKVIWLRGVYGKSGGKRRTFEQSWRNDPAISGGGILLDQGIHMLDLFRFFCGDFNQVKSMMNTAYWNIPVEDNAFVLLRAKSGPMAQLHSSSTLWKHTFRLEIGLEEGYLIVQGLLSKSGSYGREQLVIGRKPEDEDEDAAIGNPREEVVYFDQDFSWDFQVKDLIQCIQQDTPVRDSTSVDALRVMDIVSQVYCQNLDPVPEGWR